jgi:hypothetical protein
MIVATCERVGQAFLPDLVGQEWPTYLGPCRHNCETLSNLAHVVNGACKPAAGEREP